MERNETFTGNISEIEITYKTKVKPSLRPTVTSSKDIANIMYQVWSDSVEHVEEVYLIVTNRANKVLGWKRISTGGISGTEIDPKIIFQTVLKANGSAFALAHNHPSGNATPSEADNQLTNRLKQGAVILELSMLDHLIIIPGNESYYSFADEGKL